MISELHKSAIIAVPLTPMEVERVNTGLTALTELQLGTINCPEFEAAIAVLKEMQTLPAKQWEDFANV